MADGSRPIRPQPGPQENFLSSAADIAIFGGSAGGGKTWAILLEAIRHVNNPEFGAVFFRRNTKQVRNEGGLWDQSERLYPAIGAEPKESVLKWDFPSGSTISFAHLEHEKNKLDWQGSELPLILFDELTHFTESMFWYMVSRNRTTCGVKPYIRATCNPDADSWVAEFISWWIDQETGYAIPERSGVIRWFVRSGEKVIWADTPEELAQYTMVNDEGETVPIPAKSATFIGSKLTDNKELMRADPSYMANLLALPLVERERLLGGNWKIRPAAGLHFQRGWCEVIDAAPANLDIVRGWDMAATAKTETNDPDWTAGTKIGKDAHGNFYVLDHVRDRLSPGGVERLIKNTATADGKAVKVSIPKDPGAAGKAQANTYTKLLVGFNVRTSPETGDKVTRFSGFSAQAEAGNVYVLRGAWNKDWFEQLEGFPEAAHDDDVDSTSRAFNDLTGHGKRRISTVAPVAVSLNG